ncbi:FAD binding domain-containing protein [Sagittula salina]|uniref:Xanthine dehydrogenase family protein subunit M n=1 Tax=Sagittula salina TaxID=2820268 RepID=A0A940MUA1_9RHOB|nr:xanthine dehydrogenase family protein subunit M [Sagittula salina]MBP0485182.1 xanthine dehydrogenase family protein subunit M [Sagittula salina]
MIPAGFEYHRPADLASAISLLTTHGDEARVIAGGHSLIPMMKLRMADVGHLVDLQSIETMRGVRIDGDTVTIGALTTQHELITHAELARRLPILRECALLIADPQVRYCGTLGGNVANGDPGNDMPGLMQCLDATYTVEGPDGARQIKARDFYESAYFTARGDEEILTAVSISLPAPGTGYAYEKQKRKIGDYATAACAVIVGGGTASVAMTNLADTPIWAEDAGTALASGDLDGAVAAALAAIDPQEDMRGPIAFKRHVAGVVIRRAMQRATDRAKG